MATGDQADFLTRLKATLPPWFGDYVNAPIISAMLTGYAASAAFVYSLYAYLKLQARIATATDGNLDMIAGDFFGTSLMRRTGQTDANFRFLILTSLLRPRATRQGIIKIMTDLTGRVPIVQEWTKPLDTGAFGQARQAWLNLPGLSGNQASTPNSAANTITGDIDIRVQLSMVNWQDATNPAILGKWGFGQYAYIFSVSSGILIFAVYGAGYYSSSSTVNLSTVIANGGIKWVRVIRFASTGVVVFYTCDDGINWIPFGFPVAGTAGNINATTSALIFGRTTDNGQYLTGKIYKAQIYNGINGTLAVNFDATKFVAGSTSATMSTGEVFTIYTDISLWTQSGTDTPVAALGPDGLMSAINFTDNDPAAFEYSYAIVTIPNDSARHTHSVLIAKDSITTRLAGMRVYLIGGAAQYSWADLNTSTGVATAISGSAAGAAFSVADAGGGWWRLTVSVVNNFSGNTTLYAELFPANGSVAGVPSPATMGSATFAFPSIDTPLAIQENAASGLYGYSVSPSYTARQAWLNLPGLSGNQASTPNSAANTITGDIDIRVQLSMVNWQDATSPVILGKWLTPQFGYLLQMSSAGILALAFNNGTTIINSATVNISTVVSNGGIKWIRVTRSASAGTITFYTCDDGINWILLGVAVASITGNIAAATSTLYLGYNNDTGAQYLTGNIYKAQIYNGINGTLAVNFDAAKFVAGGTTATMSTGEAFTVATSGGTPAVIQEIALISGGVGGYGNVSRPYEMIINAYRPSPANGLVDADLYAAIDSVKPVATVCWVQLLN